MISALYPEPGLESHIRELEHSIVTIVRDAVTGEVEESETVR